MANENGALIRVPRHVFGHVLGDVRALLLDAVVRERRAPHVQARVPFKPDGGDAKLRVGVGQLPIQALEELPVEARQSRVAGEEEDVVLWS